jgi:hypothetical protein
MCLSLVFLKVKFILIELLQEFAGHAVLLDFAHQRIWMRLFEELLHIPLEFSADHHQHKDVFGSFEVLTLQVFTD